MRRPTSATLAGVVAIFGAPTAYEDDPERAVRAALAIRESFVDEAELDVRMGITTGEALIPLGARPQEGEGMASGDTVNSAARLEAAAPVNGVLVDEATYRATRQTIGYRKADPIEAKGEAEPIPVWEALEAKSRFGVDVRQLAATPLVGRKDQLEALVAAVHRARNEREPQLVTLVGVPGIGKSRLVWELFQRVVAEPEITLWRQDELGGSLARDALPLELLAVAARLRNVDGSTAPSPRLRVRTRAGRWAVLHASWLGEPPLRRLAVIIEQAAPAEVLPLLLAAYGFRKQERTVTGLVCQGSRRSRSPRACTSRPTRSRISQVDLLEGRRAQPARTRRHAAEAAVPLNRLRPRSRSSPRDTDSGSTDRRAVRR